MNTFNIDLINENSINIGSTYSITIMLCNAPDLMLYTGLCQIKTNNQSSDVILSPQVNIVSKDTFELLIPFTAYPSSIVPGIYQYDVLLTKTNHRFYPIGGKVNLVKRITNIV